eukprot:TRINITY_DN5514_c0_g1_i18.p1 TRINITY_DN5514_c0_g1~~TRINITY_DN5514_c0_g1_i18.p1  ORF type:complete len:760 (+),score=180.39 TRINITY_DN5514_c0_g1_i18:34-2313(+)
MGQHHSSSRVTDLARSSLSSLSSGASSSMMRRGGVARVAGVSKHGVSIRTALLLIITAGVLTVALVAILPMLVAWLATTNRFADVANDAVMEQAESLRILVVSALNTPIQAVDLLESSCRPEFYQDEPLFSDPNITTQFHACVRHLSINFEAVTDLVVTVVNNAAYTGHCFLNKANQYGVWDDGYSEGLRLYAYDGLNPTTRSTLNQTKWSMYDRPWWPIGMNLENGTDVFLDPSISSTGRYLVIFYVRQQFHYKTGVLTGLFVATYTLVSMQEYFRTFPTTQHGIAFMMDSKLYMVAAVPGYPVANASMARYYTLNHPNETIRNVASYWVAHLQGGVQVAMSWLEDGSYVDVKQVEPKSGNLRWWLVLVSPEEDFTGDLPKTNHDTLTSIKTIAISITVADFFVLLLLLLAIALFTTLIVSPLSKLAFQLRDISHMDFTNAGAAFHSVLIELQDLATQAHSMTIALKHFAKYVPTAIVKYLIKNQLEPTIGVKRAYATVFFLDVVDFTKTMDTMGAEVVIDMLQSMFEVFSSILLKKGAVIDKYIGDAIMAFWNIPESVVNHEGLACEAAFEILEELNEQNVKFTQKYNHRMGIRIGMHAGPVFAGNVGSSNRMNYTILGETVNLAARLEPMGKDLKATVCVSDTVRQPCQDLYAFRCLGYARVRGIDNYIRVHEFLGRRDSLSAEQHRMLAEYREVDDALMEERGDRHPQVLLRYLDEHKEDVVASNAYRTFHQSGSGHGVSSVCSAVSLSGAQLAL